MSARKLADSDPGVLEHLFDYPIVLAMGGDVVVECPWCRFLLVFVTPIETGELLADLQEHYHSKGCPDGT